MTKLLKKAGHSITVFSITFLSMILLGIKETKAKLKPIFADNCGENYIDTGIKILIAVVLGALLLAGLYALFGDVIMPNLKAEIERMFNYTGV